MQLPRADDFAHGDVDLRFHHHHHLVHGLLPERVRAFNEADALADVERGGRLASLANLLGQWHRKLNRLVCLERPATDRQFSG